MSSRRFSILGLLVCASLTLGLIACGAPTEEGVTAKPVLKLVSNPWSASELNIAVAKILLEEQLGYTVEVIQLDESTQWPAIAGGDVHASLEVWPSGHAADKATYIDEQKVIEYGGLLGPVGKISWYVPQYVIDQQPELASWEGYKNPDLDKLFATAETGDKGQFLAGDPGWTQYDGDIIRNLGLGLQVTVAGSEEAVLAALDAAYSRQEPILFYFWTPHSIHARYDLTPVKLPPYSEACYAKAESGGVDCDYPPDELYKIFWSGLRDYAPEAYAFLSKMNYSTDDQIQMIAAVELDGKPVDQAAREWIDAHESLWKGWLPTQ